MGKGINLPIRLASAHFRRATVMTTESLGPMLVTEYRVRSIGTTLPATNGTFYGLKRLGGRNSGGQVDTSRVKMTAACLSCLLRLGTVQLPQLLVSVSAGPVAMATLLLTGRDTQPRLSMTVN